MLLTEMMTLWSTSEKGDVDLWPYVEGGRPMSYDGWTADVYLKIEWMYEEEEFECMTE